MHPHGKVLALNVAGDHMLRVRIPYRANHAYTNDQQMTLWIDIDEAPRKPMVKSVGKRREGMVSDGVQLSFDVQHWNRINPNEEPISADMDLTDEVQWRINAPGEDRMAS